MKTSGASLGPRAMEIAEGFSIEDGAWKIKRLDSISRVDDPKLRANNSYVLQYLVGNSDDYDDGTFLLAFSSMVLLKDAAWQKGKLDGQAEAIRSGYVRDPETGTLWRLHAVPFDGE